VGSADRIALRFDSALEIEVYETLVQVGIEAARGSRRVPGNPDFVLADQQTAIFVHGCYWHRHANCASGQAHPKTNVSHWAARFSATVERDARNRRLLRTTGWNVVVLWECSIRQRPELVRNAIRRGIRSHDEHGSVGALIVA
jgi:DNA mismatch endonuclease, patch repair protein